MKRYTIIVWLLDGVLRPYMSFMFNVTIMICPFNMKGKKDSESKMSLIGFISCLFILGILLTVSFLIYYVLIVLTLCFIEVLYRNNVRETLPINKSKININRDAPRTVNNW